MPKSYRICCVCNQRMRIENCQPCPACKAVNYCSSQCHSQASNPSGVGYHSSSWCLTLKKILSESAEYTNFPFPWSKESTEFGFNSEKYSVFLKHHGVFGKGLWQFEMPVSAEDGEIRSKDNPYVLPAEAVILQTDVTPTSHNPTSWKEYYELRGFHIDSPICVLLQWPLTLYYILVHRLPLDYPHLSLHSAVKYIVHILGVEKEAHLLQVFQELPHLMPSVNFDLTLVGSAVPSSADRKTFSFVRMTITLRKGNYHDISDLDIPHLVLGFNAGIPAYVSWSKTIQRLELCKIPAFFTDYCWPAVEFTREILKKSCKTEISQGLVNPFRSPIRIYSPESEIPSLSNGVIFHLVYAQD